MIRVRYHPAAVLELQEQAHYLETQRPGFGRKFWDEVQRSASLIAQFPESSPEIEAGVRRRVLPKFQYSLTYHWDGTEALILAVAHHRRQPGYWNDRIPGRDI